MAYKLSAKADEDIVEIYLEGLEQFGSTQAEKYHADLEKTFGLISVNPQIARERNEIVPPVRIHPHASHVVVYEIDENGDVFIIRVRHAREDWMRQAN